MSPYPSAVARLGALAVTLGLGMAAVTSPGTAWADEPTTDPGPSAEGHPAEPNAPAGTTDEPSAPGEAAPDPDPTAAPPPNDGPSIIRQGESPPVVIDSSGGLIDAVEPPAPEAPPVEEPAPPAPEVVPPAVVVEPVVAPPSTPAVPLVSPVVPAPPVAVPSASGLPAAPGLARSASAAFPSQAPAATPLWSDVIDVGAQPVAVQTVLQQTTLSVDSAVTEEIAVASDPPSVSRMASSGTFIGVATSLLAAALTPFFAPGPTTPAQTPVLWAVLAWVRREFSRESYSQALQPVTPDVPQSLDTTSVVGDVVRGEPDADGAFSGSFRVVDEAGTTRVSVRDSGRSRYGTVKFTITPDTGTTRVVDYRYAPTDAGRLRAGEVGLTDRFAFTVVDGERPAETVTVADIPVVPARLVRADDSVPVGAGVAGVAVVGDRLFVADQQNDTVAAIGIGMAAGVSAIGVGAAPTCLVSDGETLYVANGGDDTVSVVSFAKDVGRHAETDRIPVGAAPFDMAVSGVLLYVANSLDSTLSVIDTRTAQTVGTIGLDDGVWSIAAARDKVYVANAVDGTVTVLDADPDSATVNAVIGTVEIDGVATALAAAPDGSRVFVTATRESGSRLAVIDTENDRPTSDSVAVSLAAADVVFSPDGSLAYLADIHGSIAAVDTSTFEVVATVPHTTDSDIGFMAVSADGGRLFVSSLTDDAMLVIDRV